MANGSPQTDREYLIQQEERLRQLQRDLREINERQLREHEELKRLLSEQFITRQEFDPIQKLVYGAAGLLLTAVVVALISLVIMQ